MAEVYPVGMYLLSRAFFFADGNHKDTPIKRLAQRHIYLGTDAIADHDLSVAFARRSSANGVGRNETVQSALPSSQASAPTPQKRAASPDYRKRDDGRAGDYSGGNKLVAAVFTPSKPFLPPPQISPSLPYPVGMASARREYAAAGHAALTQRPKKFGFANYVAPSAASATSLPLSLRDEQDELPSTGTDMANTSMDSTPAQTPTQDDRDGSWFHFGDEHDVDTNVLVSSGTQRRLR